MKPALVWILFLISVLGLNLYSQMSDAESYLNTLSQIDKNKDYDRDGKTEDVQPQSKSIKINQLIMLPLEKITVILENLERTKLILPPLHPVTRLKSNYILDIFRPPILA